MNTSTAAQPTTAWSIFKAGSIGTKFFVLVLLAVLMSIPGLFVSGMASDRADARGANITHDANGTEVQPHTVLGMKMADSYRSTQRSLKYITLFLGLVFLTYFIFEVSSGKSVHFGQYVLVGIAQTIFYLLLLSLAERVGFDLAFLIAGAATVILFSVNTHWVFVSRTLGLRAFAIFSLLYGFIYILLRLEDFALLIGAIASFLAVATTMYFTRGIDWYSTGTTPVPAAADPTQATSPRESWLE